jgi:hypothetical protein
MHHSYLLAVILLFHVSHCHAQGLVLKYIHSSTTHQQQFFALSSEASNSVISAGAWDFNNDGHQDYVVQDRPVGGDGLWSLKIYDGIGFSLLWSSDGEIPNNPSWDQPRFYDFTGDGQKEIVYSNDGATSLIVYSPSIRECILYRSQVTVNYLILDFDNDGVLDIGIYSSLPPEEYRLEIWGAGSTSSSPPKNLVIQPSGNSLFLSWQPVDSCSLYDVQWSFSSNGPYASVGTSCTPAFTHSGAAIAPRAYYRVAAITSTNEPRVTGQATYVNDQAPTSH